MSGARPLTLPKWWLVLPMIVALVFLLDRPRSRTSVHRAEWLPAGDATLRTVRAGTGDTTLLLLHGFGESLFTWRAVVDPLATGFRVVAVDLPGFGGSSKPAASYSADAMTGRLRDFVDRWIPGPVVVVGHSLGGQLATRLALELPGKITGVVLIAPAGWGVGLAGIADTMYPSKARAIGWYLSSRAFVLPEHDPEWLAEPDSAADYTVMSDSAYRQATARLLEDFDFTGLHDRFDELRQPTLVLWGTLDPVIPYLLADSISTRIPCARLVSFPGAFHRPQVEIPERVTAEIERFAADPRC